MKIIIAVIFSLVLSASALSQDLITETQKIDEFGRLYCCDFGARVDYTKIMQYANSGSQIHIIFYGARKHEVTRRNKQGKDITALVNPMRGEFRDFKRGFQKRAAFQKVDLTNFVLVNGGYRERTAIEIWLVPAGAEPPKPSSTIDEKTIWFKKGSTSYFTGICDWM